eukprot:scaffold79524_cov20-Prasinocladus_malaysianus.AAC.1
MGIWQCVECSMANGSDIECKIDVILFCPLRDIKSVEGGASQLVHGTGTTMQVARSYQIVSGLCKCSM